jgi:hypothetical protein
MACPLYWDHIATVVPWKYEDAIWLDPEMHRLLDRGDYRMVKPHWDDDFIWRGDNDVLDEVERLVSTMSPEALQITNEISPYHILFQGKFPQLVMDQLIRIGAIHYAPDSLDIEHVERIDLGMKWFVVSPTLQLALLGILVRSLCDQSPSLIPHTDQRPAHRLAIDPLPGMAEPCWQVDLSSVLPIPKADTSLEDVLEFRDRYADERKRVLFEVGRLLSLLGQQVDDPRLAIRELDRQLSEAVHDLMAAGRSWRLLWVERGILATVGVGALGIAAQLEPGYQVTWVLAGLSSIAINIATGLSRPRPPGTWAYLHHVHQAFPKAPPPPA